MAKGSKDHVATIGSLNSNFGLVGRTWLSWRPGRTLMWKVETVGQEGRGASLWKAFTSKVVAPACVG
jgi:hypothetical protein